MTNNSVYTTPPKFIKNIWALLPQDILDNKHNSETSPNSRNSMIPHFLYEFSNHDNLLIIDAGWAVRPTLYALDPKVVRQYLLSVITHQTQICFDNLDEGNIIPLADTVHKIISDTTIDPRQVHCFMSALDIEIYHNWCDINQISVENRVNFYGVSSWEYYTKKTSFNSKLETVNYTVKPKSKNFLFMNRVLRRHRWALLALLHEKKLLDKSYTSFFPNGSHGPVSSNSLIDNHFLHLVKKALNDDSLFTSIQNSYNDLLPKMPLKLNIEMTHNKTVVDHHDFELFDNSYFSLVTETFFFPLHQYGCLDETAIFFSEKTFKPIAMSHPFILVSRPGILRWLKKLGYKTFHPYINEAYDGIENDRQRLLALVDEVNRLCNQSQQEWLSWQNAVASIVQYNKSVFYEKQKHEYVIVRP